MPLASAPVVNYNQDLIPDADSRLFATSLGTWTNSGGTMTRDTTKHLDGTTASLKLAGTVGNLVSLAVAGIFRKGIPYTFLAVVEEDTAGATQTLELGLHGTDSQTVNFTPQGASSPTRHQAFAVTWTPSADRTGVTARLILAAGPINLWLLAASVQQTATPILPIRVEIFTAAMDALADDQFWLGPFGSNGTRLGLNNNQARLDVDNTTGLTITAGEAGLFLWGEHTPGDLAAAGFDLEVGADYVGLYISEKDAATVQIYADDSGGYDIELKDRGSGKHWKMVATDGGVAIPSIGQLPKYSAAPSSPSEGQGYYDTTLHKARVWDGSAWQNLW